MSSPITRCSLPGTVKVRLMKHTSVQSWTMNKVAHSEFHTTPTHGSLWGDLRGTTTGEGGWKTRLGPAQGRAGGLRSLGLTGALHDPSPNFQKVWTHPVGNKVNSVITTVAFWDGHKFFNTSTIRKWGTCPLLMNPAGSVTALTSRGEPTSVSRPRP